MGKQGTWTRWTTPERSLSWADIWQYEPLRLKFLLRSVYDVLPSPVNLCHWNLTDNPKCILCEKRGTLDHIMSSCKVALSQGRYRWRHGTVLRELIHILELERKKKKTQGKHWHHLHPVCDRRHNEYVNQQRKEAVHSTASKRLDTSRRPGQKAAISRHRPDVSQTRHCHPINCFKAPCHCGTDSTLGGKVPKRI